jgi:hypothetical protein
LIGISSTVGVTEEGVVKVVVALLLLLLLLLLFMMIDGIDDVVDDN